MSGSLHGPGEAAVEAAVGLYIDSWNRGEAEGMARSLHDGLVKRSGDPATPSGSGVLSEVTKSQMVEFTAAGGGGNPDTPVDIVVDHVEGDIASARVGTAEYLDYVHLIRSGDGWQIVNDLYRTRGT
jgi:hypothetical protein